MRENEKTFYIFEKYPLGRHLSGLVEKQLPYAKSGLSVLILDQILRQVEGPDINVKQRMENMADSALSNLALNYFRQYVPENEMANSIAMVHVNSWFGLEAALELAPLLHGFIVRLPDPSINRLHLNLEQATADLRSKKVKTLSSSQVIQHSELVPLQVSQIFKRQ